MLNAAKRAVISLLPYLRKGQILSSLLKQSCPQCTSLALARAGSHTEHKSLFIK